MRSIVRKNGTQQGRYMTGYGWNIEPLLQFHLDQNNVVHLVKQFPYIMYSIRAKNGPISWVRTGDYSNELGYYIKYRGA